MKDSNHYDIEEIKSRVDIFDVLRHFGHEVRNVCKAIKSPLRDESSPSFSIFAKGTMAKDHGTGESYDCILLYKALAGCSLHDAIVGCGKIGNLQAGALPPELCVPPPPRSVATRASKEETRESLRDKLGAVTEQTVEQMQKKAHELLDDTRPNILTQFCSLKKLDHAFMHRMVDAGMVGVLEHPALRTPAIAWIYKNPVYGIGVKLRFLADTSHKTMWWVGKSSEHFYGEQLVTPVVFGEDRSKIIVTEGESDALVLLQIGMPAVGIAGAGVLTDMRVTNMYLCHRNVGVWYDNDKAGVDATSKIQEHILKNASGSAVFQGIGDFIPQGLDIGDCWFKYGEKFADRAKKELDKLQINNIITTALPHPTI
jgi:DNA primase